MNKYESGLYFFIKSLIEKVNYLRIVFKDEKLFNIFNLKNYIPFLNSCTSISYKVDRIADFVETERDEILKAAFTLGLIINFIPPR